MASPVLPHEVFDEIISQLTDKTTLKSCSLVCRSFRRSAQKIIFNRIVITVEGPRKSTNLALIVNKAPHLIEYIQDLNIFGGGRLMYRPLNVGGTTALADALGIFSRKGKFPIKLRSLRLASLPWPYIPGLQDALVLLVTVHSLRDIALFDLTDCPPNLVANLPPLLKSFSLGSTTFSSQPTTRKELPSLESFNVSFLSRGLDQFHGDAMERIVNMTQLKTFRGGDCNPDSMPVIERILRPTHNSLKHLIFRCC